MAEHFLKPQEVDFSFIQLIEINLRIFFTPPLALKLPSRLRDLSVEQFQYFYIDFLKKLEFFVVMRFLSIKV